jgi:hypothetical protein
LDLQRRGLPYKRRRRPGRLRTDEGCGYVDAEEDKISETTKGKKKRHRLSRKYAQLW